MFFRASVLVVLCLALLHFILVMTLSLRLFAFIFVLYWFSSIASLSSLFSDGINGAVVDVSYHINSTLAGHVASIQALLLPLSPRAVGTCGR